MFSNFKSFINGKTVGWQFKGSPEKTIEIPAQSDNNFPAKLSYIHSSKTKAKFEGSYLKPDKVSFTHRNLVNLIYDHVF